MPVNYLHFELVDVLASVSRIYQFLCYFSEENVRGCNLKHHAELIIVEITMQSQYDCLNS